MTLVPELFVRRLNKPKGLPINVRDVSVTGDGQTDDYAALNEAVRSAGATGTLYFPAGTYVVGTNLTIPACCIFAFGAKLKPSSGITVTLSGPVETAPGESVIAAGTAGTVSITGTLESSGGVLDVRAFGAKGDGVTDDTAAFRNALAAASAAGGGVVMVPEGTYNFTWFNVQSNVTLQGVGRGATLLYRTALGEIAPSGQSRLFGIRLTGDYAVVRDLSVRGIWNPADPTTQTFDFNIAVMGDGVSRTLVENVETYNAHIGYNVGGIIADVSNYSGQNHNRVVNCYAHDTYDLGFGFVAKGTADADTAVGNVLMNCWQDSSYATAGCEVRYQRAAQVIGFNTSNNLNSSLGAGVRLEETSTAQVIGLQASLCYMGVQVINDTTQCTIVGATTRSCVFGIFLRHSADIVIAEPLLQTSGVDGIRLAYSDGTAWTNNNQRITVRGGKILTSAIYGIRVIGTGFTEAALADNGLGLVVDGVEISRTSGGNGMLIQAGGNYAILNCTFEGNVGFAADGFGIVMNPPAPNGVPDNDKPAGGVIDGCRFIRTADQPNTISNWTGNFGAKPALGAVTVLGGGNLPNYAFFSVEDGGFVQRGVQAAIRTVAFADSPLSAVTRDYAIRCNATDGAITVNLPSAAAHPGGVYAIKKTDATANTVTITDNATDLIDGAGTLVLTAQWQCRVIQSNGTTWSVIGAYL
jgi:hypothetical protein